MPSLRMSVAAEMLPFFPTWRLFFAKPPSADEDYHVTKNPTDPNINSGIVRGASQLSLRVDRESRPAEKQRDNGILAQIEIDGALARPTERTPPVPMSDQPLAGRTHCPLPPPERLQELLFDAARLGRDDMILALVSTGIDLEAYDPKGHTPLILASYHGSLKTSQALMLAGAAPGAPDAARGNTPLMGVAFKGFEDIARALLAAGADPNARNHAGQSAIMMAAMFGHGAIVEELIAAGADIDSIDAAGNSAKSLAAAQNNYAMVTLLDDGSPSERD